MFNFKSDIFKQSIISAFFIIIFAVAAFVLKSDIESRGAELVRVKGEVDMGSIAISSLAALQTDSEKAKNYASQMTGYLINENQLLNFSKDMNSIGQQNGMGFNVSYGQQVQLSGTNPRSTAITLTSVSRAKLENFSNFLKLIENSYYFVRLNAFDVNQEAGQLNVNLTGQVFSF